MKVAVTGVLAALLVPVAAGPAPAHPPGMYVGAPGAWVHQHTPTADGPRTVTTTAGGAACGFTSSHDETGVADPSPYRQSGEVNCGPYTPPVPDGAIVLTVTMTVTIQINNAAHGGGGVARSNTASGAVGFLSDTVNFTALPGDDTYFCSAVSWTSSVGGGSAVYDANTTAPGDQCARPTSAAVGTGDTVVCSANGALGDSITLSQPIFYPPPAGPPPAVNVGIAPFTLGGCSGSGTLSSAACGSANGTVTLSVPGRTVTGDVTVAGSMAVISQQGGTSGPAGVFHVIANAAGGESCTSGGSGADVFLLTGSVTFQR